MNKIEKMASILTQRPELRKVSFLQIKLVTKVDSISLSHIFKLESGL